MKVTFPINLAMLAVVAAVSVGAAFYSHRDLQPAGFSEDVQGFEIPPELAEHYSDPEKLARFQKSVDSWSCEMGNYLQTELAASVAADLAKEYANAPDQHAAVIASVWPILSPDIKNCGP